MSTPGTQAGHASNPPHLTPSLRRHIEEGVLVLLVVLSAIGVAINDRSPQSALRYWIWMAPTFGVVGIFAAWVRAHRAGHSIPLAVQRQVLHWAAVVGAVYLVYELQATGRMTNEAAGLTALTIIALASFLSGVYSDWRLMLVGVVLGCTVFVFALFEQYLIWVVMLPLMLLIVVAIVFARRRGSVSSEP
jgi:hypothetical protein